MLPTEPPLSLHRLVAPVPPARPQESATATHQVPAPAAVKPPTTFEHLLAAGHDQVGNSAVAGAVARGAHVMPVPSAVLPAPTRKSAQSP